MVLNTIFNNISATGIWWRSVLLVDETGVPRVKHRPEYFSYIQDGNKFTNILKKLHRKEEETVKPGQRLFTEIFLKNDSLINKYIKKRMVTFL
jgi:hypothetical protein